MRCYDVKRTCLLGSRCPCGNFSPRERQVFHLLLSGSGEKQAALALGLSHNTLHGHAKHIYEILNVGGRIELMAWALAAATTRGSAESQGSGIFRPIRKHQVHLSAHERRRLQDARAGGGIASRQARRGRILIESDRGRTDKEVAAAVGVSVRTVERTRLEFLAHGVEGATARRPQPARPARRVLDAGAEARLLLLAEASPPDGRRRWTLALLAKSLVQLGYVSSVSRDTIRRRLASNL